MNAKQVINAVNKEAIIINICDDYDSSQTSAAFRSPADVSACRK